MIRDYECSFCGKDIDRGTGMMYVKLDGSILRFCSKKCRISQVNHKRNPRKLKWTTKSLLNPSLSFNNTASSLIPSYFQ